MAAVTAKEIAARLGLSPSAVSLALNGRPGVSEQTRERVIELANRLGYVLPGGSPPVEGRKRAICFMLYVDTLVSIAEHTSFSSFILKGVEAEASANAFQTVIRYLYAGKPLRQQAANVLKEACAIVMLGTDFTERSREEIEAFLDVASTVPIVVVDNFLFSDRVDCIGCDSGAGVRLLVRHLTGQGCRSIGYFRARQRIESFDRREQGLHAALAAQGAQLGPVVELDVSSEGAYRDVELWLRGGPKLPDAFFAENDVVAASAIRALTQHGIRIPEDVLIAGYDDIPISMMTVPPITTVHVYKESIGRTAVKVLCQRLSGKQNTLAAQKSGLIKVELSTKLCVRESTARREILQKTSETVDKP